MKDNRASQYSLLDQGKGSGCRQILSEQGRDNWDRIFGKPKALAGPKSTKPVPTTQPTNKSP